MIMNMTCFYKLHNQADNGSGKGRVALEHTIEW